MRIGTDYLKGRWRPIRKSRLVRFVRKLIEEGIMAQGVKDIYENGCVLLSEMEREGKEKVEEEYMCELYLLKVRGIQKNMKENEVELLKREGGKFKGGSRKREEESRSREEKERRS